MRQYLAFAALIISFASACTPAGNLATTPEIPAEDTLLRRSLFSDRAATISEENIQKILDGKFQLPAQLRVALVRIGGNTGNKSYWSFRNDETFLKTQQAYLDLFTATLSSSPRVTKVAVIPDLLSSRAPSYTMLREAAVRLQSDIIVAYTIESDLYSNYKLFSKPDIKAFATTQLLVLDVRTGLIPFSAIVTRDAVSAKKKEELSNQEAANRIQDEAVLLTIADLGAKISAFLAGK